MRDMSSAHGVCKNLKLAEKKGFIVIPRIVHTDTGICMTGGHAWDEVEEADGPWAIRKEIRKQVRDGAEWVKILTTNREPYPELTQEELDAAVDECHRRGIKCGVHAGTNPGIQMCIDAGFDTIEHGTFMTLDHAKQMAEKYGKGYVHMTSRQGIEIPFINFEDIEEVRAKLADGGVKPGVCGPRVRTVTACQGSEICPSGCIDTYSLAKKLDEHYFGRELPHKFKFGVTGCQNNCLKAEENDIGVKGGMEVSWVADKCINCGVCEKACREDAIKCTGTEVTIDYDKCTNCGRCVKSCPTDAWEGKSGYIVSFGGLFGNHIYKGEQLLPLITDEETLFRVTDAAIGFFEEHANPGERFRLLLQRVGEDEFRKVIRNAFEEK